MKKLVLDSNIINKCNEFNVTKDFFDSLGLEIWIPTYVKNEVLDSKKEELIKTLQELEYKETSFFGFSDLFNNKKTSFFGFGDVFNNSVKSGLFYDLKYDVFIKSTVEKHHNDRYIATLSKINNAILVTNDKKLFKDANMDSINVVKFENLQSFQLSLSSLENK